MGTDEGLFLIILIGSLFAIMSPLIPIHIQGKRWEAEVRRRGLEVEGWDSSGPSSVTVTVVIWALMFFGMLMFTWALAADLTSPYKALVIAATVAVLSVGPLVWMVRTVLHPYATWGRSFRARHPRASKGVEVVLRHLGMGFRRLTPETYGDLGTRPGVKDLVRRYRPRAQQWLLFEIDGGLRVLSLETRDLEGTPISIVTILMRPEDQWPRLGQVMEYLNRVLDPQRRWRP